MTHWMKKVRAGGVFHHCGERFWVSEACKQDSKPYYLVAFTNRGDCFSYWNREFNKKDIRLNEFNLKHPNSLDRLFAKMRAIMGKKKRKWPIGASRT